ncbi:MAG: hypothetical protein CM15mV123_150 [uncultured marine virus]|nr:MAG: hypothetical protein CM15mV123_150 [uncultured marine virus]
MRGQHQQVMHKMLQFVMVIMFTRNQTQDHIQVAQQHQFIKKAQKTYGDIDWEFLHSGTGFVKITGFTSATQVTADVKSTLPASVVGQVILQQSGVRVHLVLFVAFQRHYPFMKKRLFCRNYTSTTKYIWKVCLLTLKTIHLAQMMMML